MPNCEARRYSDEMHCPKCRLQWGMNDPEPPMCGKVAPSIVPATRAHDEDVARSTRYVSALAPDPFSRK